jgi:hypothetical protein
VTPTEVAQPAVTVSDRGLLLLWLKAKIGALVAESRVRHPGTLPENDRAVVSEILRMMDE